VRETDAASPPSFQDCSFPAYFYTQPMATGPGFYDNLCPQSWQDGSAATFTLQDPHQQVKNFPPFYPVLLATFVNVDMTALCIARRS
jgi:hypothetical protein